MIDIPDHAWRYLASMCKRERERLAMIDAIGNMISLMAAFDSLNEIECAIPAEHWRLCIASSILHHQKIDFCLS